MRVWTVEEIGNLVQTNDVVLYRALRRIYDKQTQYEKITRATCESNGVGFNHADTKFMTSVCEHLIKWNTLTDNQKFCARKRLVKYTKQLTKIANEIEAQKHM